ncbi:hypothetical protein VNO77_35950 [Canavalia gladiata]|uniref:Uncharacterized protein n=1 Tax=Canavalia gladiata TaxID=3824 RepID=A0AAN9PU25_CANGL
MLIHREKLWIQLLESKYKVQTNILHHPHSRGSPVWRAILMATKELRPGYSLRLGNGETNLWYEDWSSMGLLCYQVLYVDIHDPRLKVRDITQNGRLQLH